MAIDHEERPLHRANTHRDEIANRQGSAVGVILDAKVGDTTALSRTRAKVTTVVLELPRRLAARRANRWLMKPELKDRLGRDVRISDIANRTMSVAITAGRSSTKSPRPQSTAAKGPLSRGATVGGVR